MYILNPFTGMFKRNTKKFYTYTVIQGIPNGDMIFKIQIVNPDGNIIKETEESCAKVEENILMAKTCWININFRQYGEYSIRVVIKCNDEYEIVGSLNIYIT